jgi:hypothetical protein
MQKSKLIRLIAFYSIAISLSNVFRFDLLHLRESLDKLPFWAALFFSPMEAIGVLIGALLAIYLLKKAQPVEISMFGTSIKWSIIMSIIPIVLMAVIGINNTKNVNTHFYGLLAAITTFIYCYFEEIGWRGYLEEELKLFPDWKRIVIIAVLWYVWHLSFLQNHDILENLKFFGWLLLGSWGIGKTIQLTKSIFAAACFHMIINIVMFNDYISNGIEGNGKMIILSVSIILWILILRRWKKETIGNTVS